MINELRELRKEYAINQEQEKDSNNAKYAEITAKLKNKTNVSNLTQSQITRMSSRDGNTMSGRGRGMFTGKKS